MEAVEGLSSAATWGSDGHNREAPKAEKAFNYEETGRRRTTASRRSSEERRKEASIRRSLRRSCIFSGGAMAGLLSALIAYINRTVSFDGRERPGLRRILLTLALAA